MKRQSFNDKGKTQTMRTSTRTIFALPILFALVTGCSSEQNGTSSSSSSSSGTASSTGGTTDCTTGTSLEQSVCLANALLGTLTADEKTAVNLEFTDSVSRTKWSNLPVGMKARAGAALGDLSADAQKATLALMNVVLSSQGVSDLNGIRQADAYLGTMQSGYGSDLYYIAIFGTPSATENWGIYFGGHHLAYILSYIGGVPYASPYHIATEPKASFTGTDGASYQPMKEESEAWTALVGSFTADQITSAYLAGQTFNDVLAGANEYATGSLDAITSKYPTGTNRTGLLASTLTADQLALFKTTIGAWIGNFNADISAQLIADYTTTDALADTYIAFAGGDGKTLNYDTKGLYMRIDGPRLWIEFTVQGGIVIKNVSHPHTFYRDKQFDYGGTL